MAEQVQLQLLIEGDAHDALKSLKALQASIERLSKKDVDLKGIEKLARDIDKGKVKLKNLDRETQRLVKDFRRLKKASKGTIDVKQFTRARKEAKSLDKSLGGTIDKFGRLKAAVAGAAVGTGLAAVVDQALEMESAMANVAKTTNLSAEELRGLKNELQDLSEVSGVSATALAEIAAVGGQLGVPREELGKFVTLASKMGVAFDASAQDMAEAIGTLSNSLGLSLGEVENLADAINVLGNNMAARERDITKVVTRVAGVAKTFGLAEKETAALSAAFLALGKPPEVAATAINALLSKLQTAPAQGKKFQAALASLGLSAREMATAIETDASGAIVTLLDRLKSLPPQMRAIAATQLFGTEFQDDIQLVVSNLGVLQKSLKLVKGETKGALSEEFQKRLQTAGVAFDNLKNAVANLGEAIGSQLIDDLAAGAESLTDMTNAVRDFVQHNPEVVEAAKVLAEVAVAAKALSVAGKGVKLMTTSISALGASRTSVLALTRDLGALRQALLGFGAFELGQKIGAQLADASNRVKAFGAAIAETAVKARETLAAIFESVTTGSLGPLEALPDKLAAIDQSFSDIGARFAETALAIDQLGGNIDNLPFGVLVARVQEGRISLQAFNEILAQAKPGVDQLTAAFASLGAGNNQAIFQSLNTQLQQLGLSGTQAGQIVQVLGQQLAQGNLSAGQYAQALSKLNLNQAQLTDAGKQLGQALDRYHQKLAAGQSLTTKQVQVMADLESAMNQLSQHAAGAGSEFSALEQSFTDTGSAARDTGDAMAGLTDSLENQQGIANQAGDALTAMDTALTSVQQAYESGRISVDDYNRAVEALTGIQSGAARSMDQLSQSANQTSQAFGRNQEAADRTGRSVGELDRRLQALTDQYLAGKLTAAEFERQSRQLAQGLDTEARAADHSAAAIEDLTRAKTQGATASGSAAQSETEFIQSMKAGIRLAQEYARALESLRQAKEDAARAPPARPDRGGTGGSGFSGRRGGTGPFSGGRFNEAPPMVVSSQFPPEVQQALSQATGQQRQRIMDAINRENQRQNDRLRLGGLSRHDSRQGFINAVRAVTGGNGGHSAIGGYTSQLDFGYDSAVRGGLRDRNGSESAGDSGNGTARISGRRYDGGPAGAGRIIQSMIDSAGYSL